MGYTIVIERDGTQKSVKLVGRKTSVFIETNFIIFLDRINVRGSFRKKI